MKSKKLCSFLIVFSMLIGGVAFAEEQHTFGSLAKTLIVGTDILTRFFHFACIMVGIGLCVMSVALYKAHQLNPKFVPLDRPVLYLILGLVLIAIPFLGNIFVETGSASDMKKKENKKVLLHDIDTPLDWGNDYGH